MLLKFQQTWKNSGSPSPQDIPEGGTGELLCNSAASLKATRISLFHVI